MVTIRLNGEPHSLKQGATIATLLQELGLASTKVAVELNLEIVPKSTFDGVEIKADDRLEIVHFIGGG